jgi:hypothetical protein
VRSLLVTWGSSVQDEQCSHLCSPEPHCSSGQFSHKQLLCVAVPGGGPSFHAAQHGQSSLDLPGSRAVGFSRGVVYTSDGDEQEEARSGPSGHTDSMANLASAYGNQGRWDVAEELEVQVMGTRKKKLGADHQETLNNMNNLAYTLKSLSREVEAVNLMMECVQLCEQTFRGNHPNLLSSLGMLAQWEVEEAVANL